MRTFKIDKKNYPILFLLALATALRIFNLFDLEYTYDELSALSRTGYGSFNELIEKGVKPDFHPALIQVFLYYYCMLFGTAEWVVKLPFIIAGVTSVYLVYIIGKKWFNETTGLLTATIFTCTQYFIFYSVTARPYISGLLFCLLTLNYLLNILFNDIITKKQFALFALFAALSALNHHFSLMFAGLCGIIGLFFLNKNNAKGYLLACIVAVLIYSPHLPILFYQLQIGGIGVGSGGWLNPPENDFIIQFLFYLFHYSYIFISVFIALVGLAFFITKQESSLKQNKIRMILFSLFTVSFLIGFFYSQKINPVIQYSTLIFSTPCLLLFISSFAGELKLKFKWAGMILLVIIGISTLIFKRKYYDLVYRQPFDTYMQTAKKIAGEKGNSDVFCLFKGEQWFLDFYKNKYNSVARYKVIENEALSFFDYKSIYDTLTCNYLLLGDFNAAQALQASTYYPYVYKKISGYGYELYVLTKVPTNESLQTEKQNIVSTDFNNIPEGFNLNKDLIFSQDSKTCYRIDSLNEYPLSYKIKNTALHVKEGQTIVAEIQYLSPKPIKGLLSGSTDAFKQNVHWTATDLDAFYRSGQKVQTVYVSIYVDAKFNRPDNELTIFVWNNKKEQFKILNFSVYTWNNNPYRFGLLSNF